MSVENSKAPEPGAKASWATVLNVEPGSVDREPPSAVKNPHPVLIGVFIGFFIAIVAMVVAIAVLKPPAG